VRVDVYPEAAGPVEPLLTCGTYMFLASRGQLVFTHVVGIVDAGGRFVAAGIHQRHVIPSGAYQTGGVGVETKPRDRKREGGVGGRAAVHRIWFPGGGAQLFMRDVVETGPR